MSRWKTETGASFLTILFPDVKWWEWNEYAVCVKKSVLMLWQWECGSTFFDTLRHALFHHSVVIERGHLPLKNRQSTLEKVLLQNISSDSIYYDQFTHQYERCVSWTRASFQAVVCQPTGREWTVVWLFALSQEILFTSLMTQSKSFCSQLIH